MARERSFRVGAYVLGAIVGGIVVVVAEFWAGWVVTASRYEKDVEAARIAIPAHACATAARSDWEGQGKSLDDLRSYNASAERSKLAERYATFPGMTPDGNIERECARLLGQKA